MALLLGSQLVRLTYHLAPFVLNVITTSHPFILPVVVFPQCSALGPVLFIVNTIRLSTLISTLSLDYHLCVDDTQLFFFPPTQL